MMRDLLNRTTGFGWFVFGFFFIFVMGMIIFAIKVEPSEDQGPVLRETEHGTVLCNYDRSDLEWVCKPLE